METNPFADMVESDLDADTIGAPGFLAAAARYGATAEPAKFPRRDGRTGRNAPVVDCPKCRGTGRFVGYTGRLLGNCFKCDGSGKTRGLLQDPDSVARRESYKAKAAQKAEAAQERISAWREAHADVIQWIDEAAARNFEFAVSLKNAVAQYGTLTERQVAAARSAIQKSQERRAAAIAAAPSVAGEGLSRLLKAFQTAMDNGLRNPKVRVGSLTFSPAKAASKNYGCLYVKADGEYAGKITPEGRFVCAYATPQETKDLVARVGADPLAAAVAHGKATGQCSCCGRELTDPESIARGIGPICAEKYGW